MPAISIPRCVSLCRVDNSVYPKEFKPWLEDIDLWFKRIGN